MIIDLQVAVTESDNLPSSRDFQMWCRSVFEALGKDSHVEITIRLTDNDEVRQLNRDYRGADKPTNILSFPYEAVPIDPMELQMAYAGDVAQLDVPQIGDLIIAVDVMQTEIKTQNKALMHHYAHITIHGVLHLLGYDHVKKIGADVMEAIEIDILAKMGIDNPYE